MDPLERLIAYFETLTAQRVREIGEYYAVDAYFKDPFNEVNRVEDIRAIFARMFEQLESPRLEIADLVLELLEAGRRHVVGVVADLPLGQALDGRALIRLLDERSAHGDSDRVVLSVPFDVRERTPARLGR